MEWRDQGALLSVRRHGETSAIIEVFTKDHGRHAGVVRGGTSRKIAPVLQPGAQLDLTWRARLEDHLGSYTVEPIHSRAGLFLSDRLALSGLNAITALLGFCLPEREAHPQLYERSIALMDLLGNEEIWPSAYVLWELALLEEMGFGLDLQKCAVTGAIEDLAYVSPKTGRAVSAEGAGEWADKMLPLAQCLLGSGSGDFADIREGLQTTGFFLNTRLAPQLGDKPLPQARQRLMDAIARRS